MVGHITPPVSHHHVYNIGGIGNCYGLYNCLAHGYNLYNYYHHSHVHLCLDNYCNNYYCNSLHRRCSIVHSCLGIGPYNCFAFPFPFVENLYKVSCLCLIDPCRVCSLCYYLYNSHYDKSCLSLHKVLLLLGKGKVVEVAAEISVGLYLISFLFYLL